MNGGVIMNVYSLKRLKKSKKKLYNKNTAIAYYNKNKTIHIINVYNMNSEEDEVYRYEKDQNESDL